jgi:NADH:ubiquinone oxidoreductase subunit E
MPNQNVAREILLGKIKEEQLNNGHVSESFIASTAEDLRLSVSEVFGVTTFYSFVSTEPLGRHVIRVCKSVPCCMQDAEMVIDWINAELDIAPAMLIDNQVYGLLTHEKISEILKSYE